jgi:hypothetical protein
VDRRERVAKRLSAQWAARCGCPGDRAFGVRDRRRAPIELQLASLNTRNPKRNRPSCRVAVYRPRKRKTDQSGKQPVQQVRPSLKRPYPTTESRSTERDGPEEVRQHPGGEQSSHALTTDRRWLTRRAHRLPLANRAVHSHSAQPKCREFPDSTAVSTAITSTAQAPTRP